MTGGAEARGGGQALHSRALHRLLCARELSDAEGSALICLLFPVGLAMQVLACFNAEFNLEQGEAGNIWEPLHYLLYGTGVQNFEWSVEYAIRTPLFVFPLVLLAFPARLLPVSKLQVLYSIRYASAALSCASLCFLAHSLRRTLGNEASVLGLLLCLFNHGLSLALGRLGENMRPAAFPTTCPRCASTCPAGRPLTADDYHLANFRCGLNDDCVALRGNWTVAEKATRVAHLGVCGSILQSSELCGSYSMHGAPRPNPAASQPGGVGWGGALRGGPQVSGTGRRVGMVWWVW